jgi:hypothetical protein
MSKVKTRSIALMGVEIVSSGPVDGAIKDFFFPAAEAGSFSAGFFRLPGLTGLGSS